MNPIEPLDKKALRLAFLSYFAWGFFPIYWRFLKGVPSLEILCHRMFWSGIFYLGIFIFTHRKSFLRILKDHSLAHWLASGFCALLLSINWGTYVYAVNSGQILQGSLAYFINPLLNIGVGVLFFKESFPRPLQIAFALAVVGVIIQALTSSVFPTIALTLAITFCIYGIVKKRFTISPQSSSVMEGITSIPPALVAAFFLSHNRTFDLSLSQWLLLVGGGFITGLPLYLFSHAAQKLPYSVMGLMQFIAPSLQFMVGALIFGETLDTGQLAAFLLIWLGVLIYLAYQRKKPKPLPLG